MDNKLRSFLLDWTSNFIKNKDIVSRKIEKIESNKDNFDLYVKYKDKGQFFDKEKTAKTKINDIKKATCFFIVFILPHCFF